MSVKSGLYKRAEEEETLDDSRVSVMSDEEEAAEFQGLSEGQAKILRSSLKAASEGISKGISMDFASQRNAESYIGSAVDAVLAPLVLSVPTRALERTIRPAGSLLESNESVNAEAISRMGKSILSPSKSLYQSNFSAFISVMSKVSSSVPAIAKGLAVPNDISNIEAMAIEFKATDLSVTNLSQKSPYKIIMKQIIPILREKFDAVASFDETLGSGSKIDYEGISQDYFEGMDDEADSNELVRFYKAIAEWAAVVDVFSSGQATTHSADSASKDKGKDTSEKGDPSDEDGEVAERDGDDRGPDLANDIFIHSIRSGQHAHTDPTGSGSIYMSREAILGGETPVVKLYIKGGSADKINSVGSGEGYLEYFIENNRVAFAENVDHKKVVREVTRETVSGGSEVTLYFNAKVLKEVISRPESGESPVMIVRTSRGDVSVSVDDVAQIRELKRVASGQTTSYYQAKSPSGETVYFSPADLVMTGGRLKDSKGKSFKPKNIKGKSLANKVNSKGYGKVRRK